MKKPKSPTVATLQAQLDGAHARIRDLEVRERITTEGPNTDVIEGKAFGWGDMLAWRKVAENRFSIAMGIIKELLRMYDEQRGYTRRRDRYDVEWDAQRAKIMEAFEKIGCD